MVSVQAKWVTLMAGPILAACAAAPKEAATGQQPGGGSVPAAVAAADAVGADSRAAAATATAATATAATASSTSGTEGSAAALLNQLPDFGAVDLNKQPPAENTGQICRVMLRPNTNSLVNVCGTPAQWKKYEEAEANAAQEFVLRMRSLNQQLPPSRPMR